MSLPKLSLALSLGLSLGFSLGLPLGLSTAAVAAEAQALAPLEKAWHACLREAYARQTAGQSRAGAQRNVLDECREHEDRLVAATMSEHTRRDEAARRAGLPLTVQAEAWAASVAAYVVDPVTSWLQGWRR